MKKITYILFLGFLFAQFGKNIVQYEEFDWKYIQTAHFDIYYYNNGYNHMDKQLLIYNNQNPFVVKIEYL